MDNDWQNITKIVEFRIYYGDGKIVNGKTAEDWIAAPNENVQIIFLRDDEGKRFRNNGQDLYALDKEMELKILKTTPEVKRGKMLDDATFHPLFDKCKIEFKDF